MSSSVIPKERLSAYQRWEMASFDAAPPVREDPAAAADLAQRREAARNEGHAAGYQAGYQAGLEAGTAAGQAQVQAQAEHLRTLAAAFTDALGALDREIADTLVTLALDIARQALRQTLAVRPEALLPAVREVLASETIGDAPRLLLNPEDIGLVQAHLQDELQAGGWTVRADPAIARGGCRAQSASGEIDASLPTRWERVAAALGKQQTW